MKTTTKITLCVWVFLIFAALEPARAFYDPGTQRWLNRDPMGIGRGQQIYAFVSNDPLDYVDPQGLKMVATGKPHRDSGRCSIVCDGKGGIRISCPPNASKLDPCIAKCQEEHENCHKDKALKDNPDICKGQPDGTGIIYETVKEAYADEVRCSQAELDCLDKNCKRCKDYPDKRKEVQDYHDKKKKTLDKL